MPVHHLATQIRKQRDDADGHSLFRSIKRKPRRQFLDAVLCSEVGSFALRKWERKLRHQSRIEKLKAFPRVKEGKLLGRIGDEKWELNPAHE
jgi:hypothetical protein